MFIFLINHAIKHSNANQLWTITSDGYIIIQLNGYVLDVEGGIPSSARNVIVCPRKLKFVCIIHSYIS